jgi:hypothetical protein
MKMVIERRTDVWWFGLEVRDTLFVTTIDSGGCGSAHPVCFCAVWDRDVY